VSIKLFLAGSEAQNRLIRPDPPLVKSGVSVSSPGTTQVTDPDCPSLAAFSDSLRSSGAAPLGLSSLRDQRPPGRSWQSASLTPTRLRTGHFPVPLSRARRISRGYFISTDILLCWLNAMERGEQRPQEELARPAAVLAQRFIQRWDVRSEQLEDGRYVCIREPLTVNHLYSHLRGEITLGTYVLNQESKVRFVVLDHDGEDGWGYLLKCGSRIAQDGIPAYLEKSRRGGHVWIFFDEPIAGLKARGFAQAMVQKHRFEQFEIYPKQDDAGQGLGSLIRLPFGVHRLTGRRYGFFASEGEPLGKTLREQMDALQNPQFISEPFLKKYTNISSPREQKARPRRLSKPTDYLSEKLKSRMTVLEFVGRYVDLSPNKSGAIGRCPFHDDQHPSFGVNEEGNYWHCFAGCGGGSIIDFWALWRKKNGLDPSFVATVSDLAEMLF